MTEFMNLIGKHEEEIDKELTLSHKKLLDSLKEIKVHIRNNEAGKFSLLPHASFFLLQNYLMDSTGYMSKSVNYSGKEIVVAFTDTVIPSKELVGRGENELEAIVNACDNLIANPQNYNTHSKKYLDILSADSAI